jgi:hypothetical protein
MRGAAGSFRAIAKRLPKVQLLRRAGTRAAAAAKLIQPVLIPSTVAALR